MTPLETLRKGTEILGPILSANGFTYCEGLAGHGSGGEYASGKYVKGNRILEIHFRQSLGLVTYYIGSESLRHEVFMRALLGQGAGNHYPGLCKRSDGWIPQFAVRLGKFRHRLFERYRRTLSSLRQRSTRSAKAFRLSAHGARMAELPGGNVLINGTSSGQ